MRFSVLLACALLTLPMLAVRDVFAPVNVGWRTDFAAAKREATQRKLPLLINFTCSDACDWCRLLDERVFTVSAWRSWAETHVVSVRIDLPRGTGVLEPSVAEENGRLADSFRIDGYPRFVLLAPDGTREHGRVAVPDAAQGLGRDVDPAALIAAFERALAQTPVGPSASPAPSPWRAYRFVVVVALLGVSTALLTDRNKLPLALRGLRKTLGASTPSTSSVPVPLWRRLLAFVLILLAFLIAIL